MSEAKAARPEAVAADTAKSTIESTPDVVSHTKKTKRKSKKKSAKKGDKCKQAKKTEEEDQDFAYRENLLASGKLTAAQKATYEY